MVFAVVETLRLECSSTAAQPREGTAHRRCVVEGARPARSIRQLSGIERAVEGGCDHLQDAVDETVFENVSGVETEDPDALRRQPGVAAFVAPGLNLVVVGSPSTSMQSLERSRSRERRGRRGAGGGSVSTAAGGGAPAREESRAGSCGDGGAWRGRSALTVRACRTPPPPRIFDARFPSPVASPQWRSTASSRLTQARSNLP